MRQTLTSRLMVEGHRTDEAAFRLMAKFHNETGCGEPDHWAECDALVDAIGYESWEHWQAHHEAVTTSSTARIEAFMHKHGGDA